ncbi:MAG: nucleotide exchange factor GrpE [Parvularculaceae bacterium]
MKNQYPPNEGQEETPATEGLEPLGEDALQLESEDLERLGEGGEPDLLRGEIVSLNDKILRLAAEIENTRRRADREKLDAGRYAIANFARDLLSVVDAFERAIALAPPDKAAGSVDSLWAILEGVRLSEAGMIAVLERHGVRRINPKGEKFDPNLHQAVAQAPGDVPAGFVLDVAQPGFVIGERVLRAAMVVVSTGPAAEAPSRGPNGPANGSGIDTLA